MEIKTRLTEKDFINVNMILLYRKPLIRVVTGFMILGALFMMVSSIVSNKPYPFDVITWPLVFLAVMPLMTYIGAKRNFSTNERIKETIGYEFGNDFFQIKGESFSSQLTWEKIYKVTKTKNWLLIWQSRQIANVIPRRDIWEGDMTALKEILDSHHVKNNL